MSIVWVRGNDLRSVLSGLWQTENGSNQNGNEGQHTGKSGNNHRTEARGVLRATAKFTQRELYKQFSDELVKTLTPKVSRRRCRILRENRFLSGLMFALIVLPIWLLIISLSPFDAFLAAKSAVSNE